jgi:hypothetical protein
VFDESIFERMEADNEKATIFAEGVGEYGQGVLDDFQFLIDGDAESLECSGGGIDASMDSAWDGAMNEIGEFSGGFDRVLASLFDDASGDPAAEAFFAVLVDDVG